MAILNNNPLVGASGNQGGYSINNSLRFRSSASAFLNRTFASAGSRTAFTISVWIKRGTLSTEQAIITQGSGNRDIVRIGSDNQLYFYWYDTTYYPVNTTQVFRDPSAWYHIVVAVDTTQATSSNRVKLYVNGSLVTALSNAIYPNQNFNFTYWGTTNPIAIGKDIVANNAHLDGYMAEFNFIDGSAKTPSDFGETDTTTGVWKPKAYTGTYGTNGFYLKFSDIATTSGSNAGLGKDFSGNSNYWTTNNISVTAGTTYDAMTDVPTNTSATVANYGVLNPLDRNSSVTVSQANLTGNTASINVGIRGTFGVSSGKWYYEGVVTARGGAQVDQIFGVALSTWDLGYVGSAAGVGYGGSGSIYSPLVAPPGVASFGINDIIGVAFDVDALTISFYKNNSLQGTYSLPGAGFYFVATSFQNSTQSINCGQRPFSYTPPTGYVALNTYNLPTPTILQGNKYMDATLWTGDGTLSRNITGLNFATDFVWLKSRGADSHKLYDIIRGAGNNKELESNTTVAEGGSNSDVYGYMSAFLSNGFTVAGGTDSGFPVGLVNQSGQGYVAWNWKANGTGVTNTSGSITSTVSVNTTAGFSVVTYTGTGTTATVGHGLGVAPKMIILKVRSEADNWLVYHSGLPTPATNTILLNTTGAVQTSSLNWNSTNPTSTVFSVYNPGSGGYSNKLNATYVAYCWAEIAGFSKFGSYTGNFNADGPFIYTGFRPKFVLLKASGDTGSWNLLDATRNPSNVANARLFPNNSNAEATTTFVDFLSNGFKIRTSDSDINYTVTNIYAAFAENPFKNSLAR